MKKWRVIKVPGVPLTGYYTPIVTQVQVSLPMKYLMPGLASISPWNSMACAAAPNACAAAAGKSISSSERKSRQVEFVYVCVRACHLAGDRLARTHRQTQPFTASLLTRRPSSINMDRKGNVEGT